MKRKNKPVHFSLIDADELALLAHAEKINQLTGKPRNFSKYVKGLIEMDMKGVQFNAPTLPTIELASNEDKQAMNSFL